MSGASVSKAKIVEIRRATKEIEDATRHAFERNDVLGKELGAVAGVLQGVVALLGRGFWGRMKWLLLGK